MHQHFLYVRGPRRGGAHEWPARAGRPSYLALVAAALGLDEEMLVGAVGEASHKLGLSEFFVGVFVVAIVGNAAEHGPPCWWPPRTRWTWR